MLTSVSNLEQLVKRDAFNGTGVKPAIRANDATDIWRLRGASYHDQPVAPVPHRVAVARALGSATPSPGAPALTDLGLYSITFNSDLDADLASLAAFSEFRADAAANDFQYFLEVFNPNAPASSRRRHAAIRQRRDRSLPRRPHRGGTAAISQDRLQRPEGARRARVLRSEPRRRGAGRRRRHHPRLFRADPSGRKARRAGRAVRA